MKLTTKSLMLMLLMIVATAVHAQKVTLTWAMNQTTYDGTCAIEGNTNYTQYITKTSYAVGSNLTVFSMLTQSSADAGFSSVTYPRPMTAFQPTAKVSAATAGHGITYTVTVAEGHTFKPTLLTFDAAKMGTDGGGLIIKQKIGSGAETTLAEVSPRRNKITASESIGFTEGSININDVLCEGGQTYTFIIYIAGNLATNKQLALGSVVLTGAVDEQVFDLSHFMSSFTFNADGETINIFDKVKALGNGDKILYNRKFKNEPSDFHVTTTQGYNATVEYADKMATVTITENGEPVYQVGVSFMTTKYEKHSNPAPLNRGLNAVHLAKGNLVSWRMRSYDIPGQTEYKLYRNDHLLKTFTMKTNFLDQNQNVGTEYRIEVVNSKTNEVETQTAKAWNTLFNKIPLAKAPEDTNGTGATYTPNDATCYDMDGDGEQEIVFRWEPSNAKDGANTGVTGAVYLECIKLDGTQLWRINLGQNMWASQHTITFLCYDFDGDGFGELIVRTAPGTIDGEGNFVVMGDDNPYANYVASNGRVSSGPEYLTVFDGTTGAAISSIKHWPAHDDYKELGYSSLNDAYGGQARIERYNAAMGRLDVNGKATPCAIMNHGYYSQAYYQAAYFDGTELKELWRHASKSSGSKSMFGQGYHTLQTADVDNDGFDEIVAGSAVLDHDGQNVLWSCGEGHGDALHIGDFDWENPGLEIFSVLEDYDKASVIHCQTMRDAKTGTLLWGSPKGDRDCGRGIAADFVPEYDGAEAMCARSSNLHKIDGSIIPGTNVVSDGKNFRVYWTGDLYDEGLDGTWISKWNSTKVGFEQISKLESYASGTSSINGTKNVPCLCADIFGDYREELLYYYNIDEANGMFGLIVFTTSFPSEYMLPYLRDDALYDNAITWQNSTYNQPPHLSYSPVKYWENIKTAGIHDITIDSAADAAIYNTLGQRINSTAKGIIIKAGKKVVR